ncbi:TPA: hypothetical protein DCQ44_01795 [Candidatus Taylorbacteria bacterium]|nr:hypothetical protein [Candidatus Taylorbacteria bacterium]
MNPSVFKAYDIRGTYPAEVNEAGAVQVGQACAKLFKPGKVLVAHDIRHGSVPLSKAFMEGLTAAADESFEIIFVGLSTTPMFYFLVTELGATGGCMITASHNPKNYNGFKIVEEKAHAVSGTAIRDIIASLSKA